MISVKIGLMMDQQLRLWPRTIKEAYKIAATHVARYKFACDQLSGGTVCDVACGVGYGSNLLAGKADKVVGIDIGNDAIDWANEYFEADKTLFFNCDILVGWPVEESFDAIVSYETIEHLDEPEKFVSEIFDRLKPGGKLFMSLPNGPRDKARRENPHHLQHFTDAQITSLITKYFKNAKFWTMLYKHNFRHYINKWCRELTFQKTGRNIVENYYLEPGLDTDAKMWFITACKSD